MMERIGVDRRREEFRVGWPKETKGRESLGGVTRSLYVSLQISIQARGSRRRATVSDSRGGVVGSSRLYHSSHGMQRPRTLLPLPLYRPRAGSGSAESIEPA